MSDKDYILQIRVRNGPLLRVMRLQGYVSVAELARWSGVSKGTIGHYMSLTAPAMKRNGEWRDSVLKLATALRVMPEHLFPPQHYRQSLRRSMIEVDASLADVRQIAAPVADDPQRLIEKQDALVQLKKSLAMLPDRVRTVIELRYGLTDGTARTLIETAEAIGGVSPERVRQLEYNGLRKLRHPAYGLEQRVRAGDIC